MYDIMESQYGLAIHQDTVNFSRKVRCNSLASDQHLLIATLPNCGKLLKYSVPSCTWKHYNGYRENL